MSMLEANLALLSTIPEDRQSHSGGCKGYSEAIIRIGRVYENSMIQIVANDSIIPLKLRNREK